MTISKIGTARYCLTLFCFLIYLTACSFNQAHGTDNSPDIKSSVGPSAMNCDIPITGQQKSYAHGDDGDLGMGTPWPMPRFIDNGDGTVSDRLTGLMWTKNADPTDGVIDWEDAVARSAVRNDGGHTDWRLPNRNELSSLIDLGRVQPALAAGHPFENIHSDYYWTSTTPANNEDHAWVIHFYIGFITHDDKGGTHYAWFVRNGR